MPEFDSTITFALIVMLTSLISPAITAIINNAHQSKMRKLDIKERNQHDLFLHQRDIFEKYLQYAGRFIYYVDEKEFRNYGEYYHLALLLADPELREKMICTNKFVNPKSLDTAKSNFEELVPLVYDTMEKLSSERTVKSHKR